MAEQTPELSLLQTCRTGRRVPRWLRITTIVLVVVFLGSVLNSLFYHIVWVPQGGFVSGGKIDGNRYYLGSGGRHTEVSENLYRAAQIHGRITMVLNLSAITAALAMLTMHAYYRKLPAQPDHHDARSGDCTTD